MRYMGIDYGDARVGVAITDPLGITSQGLETVPNKVYDKMINRISELISEYKPQKVIVGLPKNMDGTIGERGEISKKFVEELKEKHGDIEFILWDERLSTIQASRVLNETNTRGKKRKNVIDTVAASIILESYINKTY